MTLLQWTGAAVLVHVIVIQVLALWLYWHHRKDWVSGEQVYLLIVYALTCLMAAAGTLMVDDSWMSPELNQPVEVVTVEPVEIAPLPSPSP